MKRRLLPLKPVNNYDAKKIERINTTRNFTNFTNSNNSNRKTSIKAIIMVLICTILTSLGQIFFKLASKNLDSIYHILTNPFLIAGFLVYGLGSILLIFALKNGELSVLYPFVALSFVWVSLLSIVLFGEHVALINWAGIIIILLGVSLLGYGSSR
jgi:uncharacterized membrane protein